MGRKPKEMVKKSELILVQNLLDKAREDLDYYKYQRAEDERRSFRKKLEEELIEKKYRGWDKILVLAGIALSEKDDRIVDLKVQLNRAYTTNSQQDFSAETDLAEGILKKSVSITHKAKQSKTKRKYTKKGKK